MIVVTLKCVVIYHGLGQKEIFENAISSPADNGLRVVMANFQQAEQHVFGKTSFVIFLQLWPFSL